MGKSAKRTFVFVVPAIIVAVTVFAWPRLPIITAFAAKGMCSCVFVAGRDPALVKAQDLSFFPISLARTRVDYEDRSVTASLVGLARRRAVYRPGLGCAVVADYSEDEIRQQATDPLPVLPFDPGTVPWPLGEMLPDTLIPGVDYNGLEEAVARYFDEPGDGPYRKTQAVVVIYDDHLVAEQYAGGFDRNTLLLGWSMAKSLTNALVGILVGDGKLDTGQPAGIRRWEQDERRFITLGHLMQMTSGLEWTENYFDLSEVTRMLYMKGDMAAYAAGMPPAFPPGTNWYYSSGNPNIVSGIIRDLFGDDETYHRFPHEELFRRIGMAHAVFEADASGTFVGSSYCFATARDWARLGMLYLNGGVFAGDTILPPGWVDYSTTPANAPDGGYGAMIWLSTKKEFPDGFDDMYYFDGFLGQRVFIVPSRRLVVVRMGYGHANLDFHEFLRDIAGHLPYD